MTSYLHGKSYTRQTVANIRLRQFADNHPCSYGWKVLRVNKKHQLPVYHQSGIELMRDPDGDGWIITHFGERRRLRCHISELTAKLEQVKRAIEAQLSKQFAVCAEALAA